MVIISLGGCFSFSTYQTAFGPQEAQTVVAATVTRDDNDDIQDDTFYVPEAQYRLNLDFIVPGLSAGAKAFLIGVIGDVQYALVHRDTVAVAANLGVGYTQVETTSNDETSTATYVDLYPTVLVTYRPARIVDVTLAPKVIVRFGDDTALFYGSSAMLRLGGEFGVMGQAGLFLGESTVTSYGEGLYFGY